MAHRSKPGVLSKKIFTVYETEHIERSDMCSCHKVYDATAVCSGRTFKLFKVVIYIVRYIILLQLNITEKTCSVSLRPSYL